MKRTLILMVMALSLFAIAGCSTATAEQPKEYTFTYVHDWSEPKEPQGMVRIKQEMDAKAAETAQETAVVTEVAPEPDYWDGTAYSGPYDPELNNNTAYINGGYSSYGYGFQQQGVREFEGRTETWYSSNAAYHYRTGEWTADEEGYYRDADGNYVVAASDMPEGATFEGSKGTCKVYDSGCDEGVTDYYVSW